MQTYATVFERKLRELIVNRVADIKDTLGAGVAIPTIEEYRRYTGQIAGLAWALEACDEAKELADKAERGQ